jgi:hypothetical protein
VRISGGPDTTGLVLATLKRSQDEGWVLRSICEGVAITVPTQGIAKLNPYVG